MPPLLTLAVILGQVRQAAGVNTVSKVRTHGMIEGVLEPHLEPKAHAFSTRHQRRQLLVGKFGSALICLNPVGKVDFKHVTGLMPFICPSVVGANEGEFVGARYASPNQWQVAKYRNALRETSFVGYAPFYQDNVARCGHRQLDDVPNAPASPCAIVSLAGRDLDFLKTVLKFPSATSKSILTDVTRAAM